MDLLENRHSILPHGFTQNNISFALKSLYGTDLNASRENLIFHNNLVISKEGSVYVCWNNNVTHLLQETLLYSFWFFAETFNKKELMLDSHAKEYLEISQMAVVAPDNNDGIIYILGGLNVQTQKETASCFLINNDIIVNICKLNRLKHLKSNTRESIG